MPTMSSCAGKASTEIARPAAAQRGCARGRSGEDRRGDAMVAGRGRRGVVGLTEPAERYFPTAVRLGSASLQLRVIMICGRTLSASIRVLRRRVTGCRHRSPLTSPWCPSDCRSGADERLRGGRAHVHGEPVRGHEDGRSDPAPCPRQSGRPHRPQSGATISCVPARCALRDSVSRCGSKFPMHFSEPVADQGMILRIRESARCAGDSMRPASALHA